MHSERGREEDWRVAVECLRGRDPVLARVIDRVGPCTLGQEKEVFAALVRSILHQQLAMKAARAIVRRFVELYPDVAFPGPEDVLRTPDETLRQVGISSRKIEYIKDLARQLLEGSITPERFQNMSDEEIIAQLTKVKGIGRWTAEMFLIFSLGRANVLPVDDLGLRKAVEKLYELTADTVPGQLRDLSKVWRPYCTVATWYLWRSQDMDMTSIADSCK